MGQEASSAEKQLAQAGHLALRRLRRHAGGRRWLDQLYFWLMLVVGALTGYAALAPLPSLPDERSGWPAVLMQGLKLCFTVLGALLPLHLSRLYRQRWRILLEAGFRRNLVEGGLLAEASPKAGQAPAQEGSAGWPARLGGLFHEYRRLCLARRLVAVPGFPRATETAAAVAEWYCSSLLLWFWVFESTAAYEWLSPPVTKVLDEQVRPALLWIALPLALAAPLLFYLRRWHNSLLLGQVLAAIESPPPSAMRGL